VGAAKPFKHAHLCSSLRRIRSGACSGLWTDGRRKPIPCSHCGWPPTYQTLATN